LNLDDVSEILRKISAIKGEAMFINQELSVQTMEISLTEERINKLNSISLRKLIKEYMKRCRSSSKLQFLTPICILLVQFYIILGCSSRINNSLLRKNFNIIMQHDESRQ